MVLVDWWLYPQMDTVIGLRVFQPTSEIKMVDGSAVPNPVATSAYTTERRSWWFALPNFKPDDYVQGRIRFNANYLRGWYQNDSNYRASAGDTLFLPDTQTTFTYTNTVNGVIKTVAIPGSAPKFYVFDSAGTYRGPKLYTSAGNAGTEVLNLRPIDAKGALLPGGLDKCIDSLKSDTVWIRWGTPSSPPGQMPSAASMKCFGQNPFAPTTTSIRGEQRFSRPLNNREPTIDRNFKVLLGGKVDLFGRESIR
jgi:hypothetical protein